MKYLSISFQTSVAIFGIKTLCWKEIDNESQRMQQEIESKLQKPDEAQNQRLLDEMLKEEKRNAHFNNLHKKMLAEQSRMFSKNLQIQKNFSSTPAHDKHKKNCR